ncbi:zinc-dependent alcohol dehydrogenase family protein [Clostridiales bacterium F-3ap]|uniref:Zinc-dependent alcohol dehydrogenase family protein n=2 Tax=Anaerotalea alkaliphila TaxID=2662126 RepID=A0A7X5HXD8_9FIRM|nr:zinc-dependent alcohol dehydrogenase family protein [Anaerotalea alkaliphila]
MRALVYNSPRNISVQDVPVPEIGATEVLVKIKYCGVCGTDMHIYNGEGGAFAATPPLVMGHELSGVVEKVGAMVKKVKPGDLVSVDPNDMCGECHYCKNAMEQFCENVIGSGTTVDGGFAQYIAAKEKQVFKFKEGTDPLTAAMAEPVSCCIHGIDLCGIKPGDEVLVIGGGPIGLIMLQLAKMAGASKTVLSEPVAEKREIAEKLGADLTINPLEEDVEAILKGNCRNISTVIECVGSARTIDNAIQWAGKGATIMMFGLTGPDQVINLKPDIVFKKELKVTSSFINPYTFQRAVAILESGRLNVKDTISHIVELEDCVKVFEDAKYRGTGKAVIKLND